MKKKLNLKEAFRKHRKLFILIIIALAAAAVLIGFFLWKKKKAEQDAMNMNSGVMQEAAVRQDLKTSFTVQGRVVSGDQAISQASVSGTVSDGGTAGSGDASATGGSTDSGSGTASSGAAGGTSSLSDATGGESSGSKVREVYVKIGDRVNAGDPLFSLDMSDVEDDLWLKQQNLALQQRLNALATKANQQELAKAQRGTAQTGQESAEALKEAMEDLDLANASYADLQNAYQIATNAVYYAALDQIKAQTAADKAEETLKSAKKALSRATSVASDPESSVSNSAVASAQAEYNNAQAAVAALTENSTKEERTKANAALASAESKLEQAKSDYADAQTKAAKKAQAAVTSAQEAYDDANEANTEAQAALDKANNALSDAKTKQSDLSDKLKDKSDVTEKSRAVTKAQSDADAKNADSLDAETAAADKITTDRLTQQQSLLEQEQAIKKAQEQLKNGTVVAGISGTVTAVNVAAGQAITSSTPVVISNLDELKVVVDVEEAHIADVFTGQNVYLTTDSTGDEPLTGQVTFCAATPTADASATAATTSDTSGIINSKKKVYYRVEVAVTSSTDRLRVGMNAKMEFVMAEVKDAICVPNDALQTDMDGEPCVYVLDDASANSGSSDTMTDSAGNVYRAVKVTTGVTDGTYTEITSGNINEGDTLYGTGASYTDNTGMNGTDYNYTDNSQLLEGIYN